MLNETRGEDTLMRLSGVRCLVFLSSLLALQACADQRSISIPDARFDSGPGSGGSGGSNPPNPPPPPAPIPMSVVITPNTVNAGSTATGTVTLSAAAPSGGMAIVVT